MDDFFIILEVCLSICLCVTLFVTRRGRGRLLYYTRGLSVRLSVCNPVGNRERPGTTSLLYSRFVCPSVCLCVTLFVTGRGLGRLLYYTRGLSVCTGSEM